MITVSRTKNVQCSNVKGGISRQVFTRSSDDSVAKAEYTVQLRSIITWCGSFRDITVNRIYTLTVFMGRRPFTSFIVSDYIVTTMFTVYSNF